MTINEIQQAVDGLQTRHDPLTKELLITLLQAGGWDETSIQEALVLWKHQEQTEGTEQNLPLPSDEKMLPSPHDMLLEKGVSEVPLVSRDVELPMPEKEMVAHEEGEEIHTESVPESDSILTAQEESTQSYKEPEVQSLVSSSPEPLPISRTNVEPPHNLPLKPFETSSHVWPFSRYKDVFHGDVMTESVSSAEEEQPKEIVYTPPVAVEAPAPVIALEKIPLDTKDEGLIALATICFVFVALILIYMYSLGRL